jgi:hypothetical protein
MRELPDFSVHCEAACRRLWGEPSRSTPKQLHWNGGNAYSARTYDIRKHLWFDAGQQRGGSTLELVDYHKGRPKRELRGSVFFDIWREANAMGIVPDPAPPPTNGGGKWPPILATYPYHDESSVLLFEVVRFDTTDPHQRFRQRRPDGKGGWIWDLKGVRRVLYRLPELIEARAAGKPILNCEGERDANTAVKLGYAATTMPGGINKWLKEYDEFLRGADVVVVSDNDPQARDPTTGELQTHPNGRPILPGQDHAERLAKRLVKVAAQMRKIMFEVKDLTDWVAAGGTRAQLDALIDQAPVYKATPEPAPPEPKKGDLEDLVALQFAQRHADHFRYVADSSQWMRWANSYWQVEKTLFAFDQSRKLCRDAGDARAKTVSAVTTLARSDRRIAATTDQWDSDAEFFNTPTKKEGA